MNYDISKPRLMEVKSLENLKVTKRSKKHFPEVFITSIKDERTGRLGIATGKWARELRLGDKVKVRWERTAYRDNRSKKLIVKWAIRPAKKV